MSTRKRTGLATVLLVAGGLAAAGFGLGAGTASADTGGLNGILGGTGGSGSGGSGILSKMDELQPVIDAVREDPKGMINAVLDNPSDLIGLLGG